MPTGERVFSYPAVESPVLSSNPAAAKPIGVGPVANGGDTVHVTVNIGPFVKPVNLTLAVYAAGADSGEVYLMDRTSSLVPMSSVVASQPSRRASEDSQRSSTHSKGDGEESRHKNEILVIWRNNVTSLNEDVFGPAPLSQFRSGTYMLVLGATPSGSSDDDLSYHWVTSFIVP